MDAAAIQCMIGSVFGEHALAFLKGQTRFAIAVSKTKNAFEFERLCRLSAELLDEHDRISPGLVSLKDFAAQKKERTEQAIEASRLRIEQTRALTGRFFLHQRLRAPDVKATRRVPQSYAASSQVG